MGRGDSYLAETIAEIKQMVLVLVTLNKKLKKRVVDLELQNKSLEEEKNKLALQLQKLQEDYSMLKLAKSVQGESDNSEAKMQISKLMREINQCMALVQNL